MKNDHFLQFLKHYQFYPPCPVRLLSFTSIIRLVFGLAAFFLFSCGKKEDLPPDSAAESSYEFRFGDGPLAGKQIKASGLTEEKAMALYARQPGTDSDGISIQLNTDEVTLAAGIMLDGSNQPLPLKPDSNEPGSQIALSIRDGNTTYVYSGESGRLTMKSFTRKAGGHSAGGLAAVELEFADAVFIDAAAAGNNEHVEVKLSGKISIK